MVSTSSALMRRRVAGAAQAAREQVGGTELLSDLGGRHGLVAVGEHAGPGERAQRLDLAELGDDVLGDAVAQVLVLLHAREVLEVEDGERLLGGPCGSSARVVRRGRGAVARVGLALEPQQVRLELGRALVAQAAVLLERLLEDPVELRGKRGVRLRDRGRVAVQDRLEHDGGGLTLERQHARRHLVEHRPEREQIRPRVRELPARLLRRHVRHRPHRRARARQLLRLHRRRRLRVLAPGGLRPLDLRETEVQDLRLPARRHEDVGGLQVAVHDPLRVRRLERVRDLDPELQQRARARPAPCGSARRASRPRAAPSR